VLYDQLSSTWGVFFPCQLWLLCWQWNPYCEISSMWSNSIRVVHPHPCRNFIYLVQFHVILFKVSGFGFM
jgi:hypothetical protein